MGGRAKYASYIIVPKSSPVKDFTDLKGRRFAFSDPMSMSGRLVPLYYIQQSDDFASPPVVVRTGLDPALKVKLRDAFLQLNRKENEFLAQTAAGMVLGVAAMAALNSKPGGAGASAPIP